MMKILIILLIVLFFYNKNIISLNILEGINIWYTKLFPSIFPVLVLGDLLISTNINCLIKYLGAIFRKLFKISKSGIVVFIMSLLAGTPSNFSLALELYKNNLLSREDINKLLSLCLFFNPLFVIGATNLKCYLIIIIASIIVGILMRNYQVNIIDNDQFNPIKFNLSKSIEKNMKTLINILGTVVIFMILANIIIIKKPIVSCILGGIFEITTGLYKTNLFFNGNNYLYLFMLSFGGLSIIIQIKGIISPINIDYKLFIKSRILVFLLSVFICYLT